MSDALPKIEGHAAFYLHLKKGEIDKARMIGLENDRFVEKILFGRKFWEAPIITSRICGICPTIHSTTSVKAIEAACGISPTKQTIALRKLMLAAQMVQSHSLHLYLLVLPDYVGVGSSFELQKAHPDLFQNAIELKRYADSIIETIGGRAVHPIANVPGGFKSYPSKEQLKKLYEMSEPIIEIAEKTVRLFSGFQYPEIHRQIFYSALRDENEYDIYDGEIWTTAGDIFKAENYTNFIYEELRPYTKAKFGTLKGQEIMVGSMARLNINKLNNRRTEDLMQELEIKRPFDNPFDNIIAQAIENFYFCLESQKLIKKLLDEGVKEEFVKIPTKFGIGTAACEAPRGTLYHHYELDKEGNIQKCDIITPTVQNFPALEKDFKLIGPLIEDMEKAEADKIIETLIRSYDPCITCATH